MYHKYKVILTVCARGGSKGVPGKNIKNLVGKPLILYTLTQARKLKWVDRIALSTDSKDIKKIAEDFGIEVPFLRPKYLATDKADKVPAITNAIRTAEKFWKEKYDISIDLDATSPFRTTGDIENTVKILINEPKTKTVVTGYPTPRNPYFNIVEPNKNGYIGLSKKLKIRPPTRQDSPPAFAINSSIWTAWVMVLLKERKYFTNQTRLYLMPESRSIDIDKQIDFDFAEYLLSKKKIKI